MALDDLLTELGRWGFVNLDFKWGRWICEVRVPGYLGRNLTSYVKGEGPSPREAVESAWKRLEEWSESGQMAEDRARYLEQHRSQQERYDRSSHWQRSGNGDVVRPPPPLEPERPLRD